MSSGLLFLTNDDFFVAKGTRGNVLCHGIPSFSLILFYSTQCIYCQKLIPIFKSLPGSIAGCQFGMINVQSPESNKQVVGKSRQTIAPIAYVPYIVLYFNGRPHMRYDGPHDPEEIKRFIMDVAKSLQEKQQFTSPKVQDNGKGIPAYCIGKPLYGHEDVCYLEMDEAYGGGQGRQGAYGGGHVGYGR
jgi:hypothetical protein